MLNISKTLRSRFAMIASVGITGALLVATPLVANAAPTVITYTSTNAADYPALAHVGGGGGTDWKPWRLNPDTQANEESLNAPGVVGDNNWRDRPGWDHGWVVQGGALWVQKAQAGAPSSGIQLAAVPNGQSLISSSNKVITLKVKAADANLPIQATLTDYYGGHALTLNATAKTVNAFNTVTLNFAKPTSGTYISNFSYSKLSVVFDPANAKAGNVHDNWGQGTSSATVSKLYLVDDLTYTVSTGATLASGPDVGRLLTFEDGDTLGAQAAGEPTATKWGGAFEGAGTGIATPATAHTGKALEFNKGAAGNAWSGVNLVQAPAGEVITSSNYKTVKLDFFSPETVSVPVQFELIPTSGSSLKRAVDAAPGWNTLTVDFSVADGVGTWNAEALYTKLTVFPNFKNDGVGPSTATAASLGSVYYIDNVLYNGYALPTTVDVPTFNVTLIVGNTLTAGAVAWSGNTVQVSYKWYRCTVLGATARATAPISEDGCTAISGATRSSYTLSKSDRGKYVRVAVIGTTTAGAAYALAPSTSKVG